MYACMYTYLPYMFIGIYKIDDINLSNPYVCVSWNDEELLKTEPKSKTTEPSWTAETAMLKLPWLTNGTQARVNSQKLYIEVYEKNPYGPPVFLGCLLLTGQRLTEFIDIPGGLNTQNFTLEKDPNESVEANAVVQVIRSLSPSQFFFILLY